MMHDIAAKRDYSGGMPLSVSYRAEGVRESETAAIILRRSTAAESAAALLSRRLSFSFRVFTNLLLLEVLSVYNLSSVRLRLL